MKIKKIVPILSRNMLSLPLELFSDFDASSDFTVVADADAGVEENFMQDLVSQIVFETTK